MRMSHILIIESRRSSWHNYKPKQTCLVELRVYLLFKKLILSHLSSHISEDLILPTNARLAQVTFFFSNGWLNSVASFSSLHLKCVITSSAFLDVLAFILTE